MAASLAYAGRERTTKWPPRDAESSTERLRVAHRTPTRRLSAFAPGERRRSASFASARAASALASTSSPATRDASASGTPARRRSEARAAAAANRRSETSTSPPPGIAGSRRAPLGCFLEVGCFSERSSASSAVSSASFAAKRHRSNACGGGAPAPAATPAALSFLRSLSRAAARAHSSATAAPASRATRRRPQAVANAGGGAHFGAARVTSHGASSPGGRTGRPRRTEEGPPGSAPPTTAAAPASYGRTSRGAFVCTCAGRTVVAEREGGMRREPRSAGGGATERMARAGRRSLRVSDDATTIEARARPPRRSSYRSPEC